MRLDEREVTDHRFGAVEYILYRAESRGRLPSARLIAARALPILPEPARSSSSAARKVQASPGILRRACVASIVRSAIDRPVSTAYEPIIEGENEWMLLEIFRL